MGGRVGRVGFYGWFGDEKNRAKCGCGGEFQQGFLNGRVGGGDEFGGGFLNHLYERFTGEDEGLGDVGGMLQQIYYDSEVFQYRRLCLHLAGCIRRGIHDVSVVQNRSHADNTMILGFAELGSI